MEPNYSEYSIAELQDALANIDKKAYPERVEKIESELSSRQPAQSHSEEPLNDDYEPNEQFFKCPTCEKKIGFFSKTANKWGKNKECPHCSAPFESFMKWKVFAIALIPVFFVHLFVLRPLVVSLGFNGAISTGIICGLLTVFAMRYRKVRSPKVT
jgi:hypothetical protein